MAEDLAKRFDAALRQAGLTPDAGDRAAALAVAETLERGLDRLRRAWADDNASG